MALAAIRERRDRMMEGTWYEEEVERRASFGDIPVPTHEKRRQLEMVRKRKARREKLAAASKLKK